MSRAANTAPKYTTMDRLLVTRQHASKAAALKAAATLPGPVRVATPAGNLVRYVGRDGK